MRIALISLLLSSPIWAAFTSVYSVTVDHTKVGGTDISNYVLWVCANGSTAPCDAGTHTELSIPALKTTGNGGDVTSSSGYDVRFSSSSACTAMLDYELEAGSYVPTTGFGSWFVQIGTASASVDTVIYMCIGDASITTDGTSTTTWTTDSSILHIYHLPMVTGDSTKGKLDSTGLNDLTLGGASPTSTSYLNGADNVLAADGVAFATSVSGLPAGAVSSSMSIWFNSTATYGLAAMGMWQFSNNSNEVSMFINRSAAGKVSICANGGCGPISNASVNDGNWHYIVASTNGSNSAKIYIDGSLDISNSNDRHSSTLDSMAIAHGANDGGFWACSSGKAGGGCKVDEVRYRSDQIAAGMVTADYNNQSSPWTFYAFAEATPASAVPHRVISQ
jgi:hypothetical protein